MIGFTELFINELFSFEIHNWKKTGIIHTLFCFFTHLLLASDKINHYFVTCERSSNGSSNDSSLQSIIIL